MNAIDADEVTLTYSDGTEAVRGIDLDIPEGEFFGFLGPNGAGKTTAIKTFATLLRPTSGTVTVNGFDVADEPRAVRESIGYMAQDTSVDEELTARENIRFACEAYGVPKAERGDRIDGLLDLVDLAEAADKEAEGFSGGMKKRLDAAMALVHRPPLVFLDEPTTGLDPKARNRLWEYFRRINGEGTTIFLTTQYLEEADQLCERTADSDLFEDQASVETTEEGISVTSRRAREAGTDLLVALRDEGLTVTGFNIRAPTLDDVFLAITGESVDDSDEADETDGSKKADAAEANPAAVDGGASR
ncbi:daunorubicin ABC transporter ATP-binding protein [Halobacteriales archaeon SW_12_67_38]|nr:MAG: daunorubicin ABC transporter ATP-binding protein [Halobacteriales archaeon SW_12_67_38]